MTTSAVIFPIGDDLYAVDATTVRQVIAQPHATALPTAPDVLLGVFNLRGEVVPVFDTAALLGLGRMSTCDIAVVVNTSAGAAGLSASGLPTVAVLGDTVGPSELRGTVGVHPAGDRFAVLLDVEALLLPHSSLAAKAGLTEAIAAR